MRRLIGRCKDQRSCYRCSVNVTVYYSNEGGECSLWYSSVVFILKSMHVSVQSVFTVIVKLSFSLHVYSSGFKGWQKVHVCYLDQLTENESYVNNIFFECYFKRQRCLNLYSYYFQEIPKPTNALIHLPNSFWRSMAQRNKALATHTSYVSRINSCDRQNLVLQRPYLDWTQHNLLCST